MAETYEKEVKVNTFIKRLFCKKCDVEMEAGNICLTSNPPQFPHTCPKCGNTVNTVNTTYPVADFKEV